MSAESYIERKRYGRPYSLRLAEKTPEVPTRTYRERLGQLAYLLGLVCWIYIPIAAYFLVRIADDVFIYPFFVSPIVGLGAVFAGLLLAPSKRAKIVAFVLLGFSLVVFVVSIIRYFQVSG